MKKLLLLGFIVLFLVSCASLIVVDRGLRIDKLIFASEVNGYRDYVEKPKSTFYIFDDLYIYMEFSNIRVEDGIVSVSAEISLYDPDGTVLFETQFIDYNGVEMDPYAVIGLRVPYGIAAGKYTVEVFITDHLSGETAHKKSYFYVDVTREI